MGAVVAAAAGAGLAAAEGDAVEGGIGLSQTAASSPPP